MAVNPMQKKARNKIILGMFLMLVIGGIAVGILIWQMNERQTEIKKLTANSVYVLNRDIESGETITSADFKIVKQSYPVNNALSMSVLNDEEIYTVKARTALSQGVVVTNDMVYAEMVENAENQGNEEVDGIEVNVQKDDVRIVEYNMIKLPSQLEKGKYIDIRLTLPTGQDFVVVSHKEVLQCDTTTVWIKVSEDEMTMINNAIIEYFIMKGSELYAVTYDKAGLQKAATPTYAMSSQVAYVYRTNPNILKEVQDAYTAMLANENKKSVNDQIRTLINNQLGLYSDDRLNNIESGVEKSRENQKEKRRLYITDLDALQN